MSSPRVTIIIVGPQGLIYDVDLREDYLINGNKGVISTALNLVKKNLYKEYKIDQPKEDD